LTDRLGELSGVPDEPLLAALHDENPRVRAQAIISLGRLGREENAAALLPLTLRSDQDPLRGEDLPHSQPDPGRVPPHLAVRALVQLNAREVCLEALNGPYAAGALAALQSMHDEEVVAGLARKVSEAREGSQLRGLLTCLIRLYHREGEYTGDWWGTRPDTSGPYYDRQTWSGSERIAMVLRAVAESDDDETRAHLRRELERQHVEIEGLSLFSGDAGGEVAKAAPIAIPAAGSDQPDAIANLSFEEALTRALESTGDAKRGEGLFTRQSCTACHTNADGQAPKGPHLADIGMRYQPAELLESILRPSAKIAQGFDTQLMLLDTGKSYVGFVVLETAQSVRLQQSTGVAIDLAKDEIELRVKRDESTMPEGLANNLTPTELADLLAYLQTL
jgi:putative heme-binding domain-containing protein